MIQDMFDPEIYLSSFEARDTSSNSTVSTDKVCVISFFVVGWLERVLFTRFKDFSSKQFIKKLIFVCL